MNSPEDLLRKQPAAVEMDAEEFRAIGHRLVDRLADFLSTIASQPVTKAESPAEIRAVMHAARTLPESGSDAASVVADAAELLLGHSLFNGHPRFFGYVTSSAMPAGAFGDFLAAVANPNVGAWKLSPAASEIEAQTIRWIAELIGYPPECGGLFVSGGNMANFVGFLAARAAAAGPELRKAGLQGLDRRLLCYCSSETHTWIQKATDLAGLGTDSIRWIPVDDRQRMDMRALRQCVDEDIAVGHQPVLVAATAGSVSTGAVDPLPELAAFCRERGLWLHVDGAYGGFAACVPSAPSDLHGIALADSVAIDAHKWLYAPLEAGCVLVRNPQHLLNTFSYKPPYYNFDVDGINYYDFGPQNSRGFRALKVWLALQQAGRSGYVQTIAQDIALAQHAFRLFEAHPEFEAVTCGLSICTFRYVPESLRASAGASDTEEVLNKLNQGLLAEIEKSGDAFLSNAIVGGKYLLRMCIVNFRTTVDDIEALPALISGLGARVFARMKQEPGTLSAGR